MKLSRQYFTIQIKNIYQYNQNNLKKQMGNIQSPQYQPFQIQPAVLENIFSNSSEKLSNQSDLIQFQKIIYQNSEILSLNDSNHLSEEDKKNQNDIWNQLRMSQESTNDGMTVCQINKQKDKITKFFENKDGSKYIGQITNNQRNGEGAYYYIDKSTYQGQWKDDKRNGNGVYTYTNGTRFIGQWKQGDIYGVGTYYYKDGYKYEVAFEANKKNGKGTKIKPDGTIQAIQNWNEDIFIE